MGLVFLYLLTFVFVFILLHGYSLNVVRLNFLWVVLNLPLHEKGQIFGGCEAVSLFEIFDVDVR